MARACLLWVCALAVLGLCHDTLATSDGSIQGHPEGAIARFNSRQKSNAMKQRQLIEKGIRDSMDVLVYFRGIDPLIREKKLRHSYSSLIESLANTFQRNLKFITRRRDTDSGIVDNAVDSISLAIKKFLAKFPSFTKQLSDDKNLISHSELNKMIDEEAKMLMALLKKLKKYSVGDQKLPNDAIVQKDMEEVFERTMKLEALRPLLKTNKIMYSLNADILKRFNTYNGHTKFDHKITEAINAAEKLPKSILDSKGPVVVKDYPEKMKYALRNYENQLVKLVEDATNWPEYKLVNMNRPREMIKLADKLSCHLHRKPIKDNNQNSLFLFAADSLKHLANQQIEFSLTGNNDNSLKKVITSINKTATMLFKDLSPNQFDHEMDPYCISLAIIKTSKRITYEGHLVFSDKIPGCLEHTFFCFDSKEVICTDQSKICDGNNDCDKGEDERDCDYGHRNCEGKFDVIYCKEKDYHQCVDVSPGCNCPDNDTAYNPKPGVHKKTTTSTTTTTTPTTTTTTTKRTTPTTTTKRTTPTTTTKRTTPTTTTKRTTPTTTTKRTKPTTTTKRTTPTTTTKRTTPTTTTKRTTPTTTTMRTTTQEPEICPEYATCINFIWSDERLLHGRPRYFKEWRDWRKPTYRPDYREQFYYYDY